MTTKEALELAISELEIVAHEATSVSDYEELRKAIAKLRALMETM